VSVAANAVLVVGVGMVLALPLAWRVASRRFDPFEPIVVFGLAWGVMFVLRPAAILIRDDTIFYGVDISPTLGRAILLGLLGAAGFVVGYELSLGDRVGGRLPVPRDRFEPSAALIAAFAVSGAGMLALALVLLPSGGLHAVDIFLSGRSAELNELIHDSTLYLWYGSLLVIPAALVGIAVAISEPRRGTVAPAALLMGVALLRTVPTGNRIFLLVLLGGAVVFVFLHLNRRPGFVALVAALGIALVVSYALLNFRDPETRRGVSPVLRGLVNTPSKALKPLVKGPDAEMAPALAGALLAIPDDLSFRYGGATFGDLVLRPIPRELWSGKPEPPTQEVAGEVWPSARALGGFDPAFTPLLNFYWDFWLPGVVFGMLLLGIAARALYEYAFRQRDNLVVQLVYAAALCYLAVVVRHDPVDVLTWGIVLFVPLVGVFRAAGGRRASVASRPEMSRS
jgi:hypothetical protein